MSDEYITINATANAITDKAVHLENEHGEAWIPRSCLHAATDLRLKENPLSFRDEHFKIREWAVRRTELVRK